VITAYHLFAGHPDDKDLVLKLREHPHSIQQGCVPGIAHSLPTESFESHELQTSILTLATSSTNSLRTNLFLIPSSI